MKPTRIFFWMAAIVLMAAAPSFAEYGNWERIHTIGGTPGFSNAVYMSLGIGDAENLYTAGMQQTGSLSITYAWDSHDGGYTWSPLIQTEGGSDECSIMNMFAFVLTAGAANANTASFAGIQVDPKCVEENTFPACMFKCMWKLVPVMYVTTDGGLTVQEAPITGAGLLNMAMAMTFVDDSLGYAAGIPNLLMRTQDGGLSWTKIASPGNIMTYYNDLEFLDANTGYLVSGVPEEEKKTGDPERDQYNQMMFAWKWVKDPIFRMNWREQHEGQEVKGQLGKFYRTTDGGATWENTFSYANASFLNVEMLDEEAGFIIGEPHTGTYPIIVFKTIDGGDTWTDISDHLPQELPNVLKWAVSSLDFQPMFGETGFIGGVGQKLTGYLPILFYTTDQGETWQADETVQELENPIMQLKWVNPKTAFTVGFELSVFKYTQANVPPLADAGEDAAGVAGQEIALDGSASFDYDEDALTYQWTQISGPTATIANATAAVTTFVAAEAGEAIFQLVVNDGQEDGTDSVTFTITGTGDDDDNGDDDDDESPSGDDDDDNDDDDDDSGACGC